MMSALGGEFNCRPDKQYMGDRSISNPCSMDTIAVKSLSIHPTSAAVGTGSNQAVMGIIQSTLLWASENQWLESQFRRRRFARRAVSRFMPGEHVDDALAAASSLAKSGISTILTELGENVATSGEIDAVVSHYLAVLDRIAERQLDTQVSVKLTQLGLDVDRAAAAEHLNTLLERAGSLNNFVWLDMEQSCYVDATLDLYRGARDAHEHVGICIQAYLRRSERDLAELIGMDGTVRLVKGAYSEPPDVAYPAKRDVDDSYFSQAQMLLQHAKRRSAEDGSRQRHAMGTHDLKLVARIRQEAEAMGMGDKAFEVDMLYGIRRSDQASFAQQGVPMRVLISYGESWYPWYVRRLAERPANLTFVLMSLLRG